MKPAQSCAAQRGDTKLIQPISVSPVEAAKMVGVSRSKMFELISGGQVRSNKVGGRRVVLVSSLRELVGEAA